MMNPRAKVSKYYIMFNNSMSFALMLLLYVRYVWWDKDSEHAIWLQGDTASNFKLVI